MRPFHSHFSSLSFAVSLHVFRTDQGEWMRSVHVWMFAGISTAAKQSAVHVMNEIVRQPWIYGCEFSHPSRPAVPDPAQGHYVPSSASHLNWFDWGSFCRCCRVDGVWAVQVKGSSGCPHGMLSGGKLRGKWAQAANVHTITERARGASERLPLLIRPLICPHRITLGSPAQFGLSWAPCMVSSAVNKRERCDYNINMNNEWV